MERVTTIRADQWELVAEDVKAGRCEVTNPLYDYAISHIKPIKPNSVGWNVSITDTQSTYRTRSSVDLTVRWLDTAQAKRDAEAMDNHDLKMWALSNVNNPAALAAIDRLVSGSYDLQVSADANGWYDGKMEALKEIEALQSELEATRKQVAAAVRFRNYTAVWHKPDGSKVLCPVTYMSSADWVQEFELFAESVTTPQPAPAVDGGQVGKYVVCRECDGTGKLFVPEEPTAVLPELDSDGQPAPAGNSELVAAEIQALREMDEIYYLDWCENDDDENTAGWRYEGYYDINGKTFDKLIALGLVEVKPSGAPQRYVRINKAGTAALKGEK